jgi:hypothetical protein
MEYYDLRACHRKILYSIDITVARQKDSQEIGNDAHASLAIIISISSVQMELLKKYYMQRKITTNLNCFKKSMYKQYKER